ncbi:hypothetical protein J132_08974 [Termitomyces sp. J132]|nr:hypothetical protein J132_08974 [Termitomyces sp. J132]
MMDSAPMDGSICFPHLSHTNYVKWAMRMEAVLVFQGYWDFVEDAQLAHMTDPNPYTIWENLAKVHHACGFGSHLALCCAFITASMKEGQTMEAWIGEVHSLANCLTAIDVSTSDEDIIVVLTAGLPPSYETVANVLLEGKC